jgi:membrane-associated phospholipid phosphatase
MGWEQSRPVIIAIVAIFLVLSIFLLLRKKRGKITNLDVSDRKQRAKNVYWPALGMVTAAALYFKWADEPHVYPTMFVGALIATCFAINSVKKISLHTVVATYLSALVMEASLWIGAQFFVFAALIAWSRVVLGRHTRDEVMLGWGVGSVFGLLYVWLF